MSETTPQGGTTGAAVDLRARQVATTIARLADGTLEGTGSSLLDALEAAGVDVARTPPAGLDGPRCALIEPGLGGLPRSGAWHGAIFVADVEQLDAGTVDEVEGWASEQDLVAGEVILEDGVLVVSFVGTDGADGTGEASGLAEQLVGALASSLEVERARAAGLERAISHQHRRTAQQLTDLRAAHKRQMAKVYEGVRYRLGAALVDVAYHPRKALRLPKTLRELYRSRTQEAVLAPVTDDVPVVPRLDLPVASILDEFSEQCFEHEARLLPLDPERWESQLADRPAMLFVESAWRGNGGRWSYAVNKFASRDPNVLAAVLDWCREHGIPSVFWNKEDPVNFEAFLDAARHFDIVLTTDADVVGDYVRELGHDRVAPLPFAAQPKIHNPIGSRRDVTDRVCFAGAWRGDKYAQRGTDFEVLLDPALRLGRLDIYDRYAGTKQAAELGFPSPYKRAVIGSLPYSEMVEAYKRYAAFLNVNSVSDSPTMFSRRVFEILASGTPVISTWARGIEEMLADHVIVTTSAAETHDAVELVVHDREERERRGHLGYRFVHTSHTYRERFGSIIQQVGDLAVVGHADPLVSVICVSNRPEYLHHLVESYKRQTYANTELIFVQNSSDFDQAEVASLLDGLGRARTIVVDPQRTLADCLNEALAIAEGDYFAKFDDDDEYGAHFLSDLMLTFEYSQAAVAGKRSYFAYLESQDRTVLRFPDREFCHVNAVVGGTIVADRRATAPIPFTPVQRGTDTVFIEGCREAGLRIFSADRYNFVQRRHADLSRHTWQIEDERFLANATPVSDGLPKHRIFI